MGPRIARVVSLLLAGVLTACSEAPDDDEPYVEFLGGGFIYNYRLAEADYGFVVRPLRRIPDGTILEASFENPDGGAPFVVDEVARWNRAQYVFRSPPVRGIVAGREYRVALKLLEPTSRRLLASYSRTFRAELDQSVLPERPPVMGPGYQRAPPG